MNYLHRVQCTVTGTLQALECLSFLRQIVITMSGHSNLQYSLYYAC